MFLDSPNFPSLCMKSMNNIYLFISGVDKKMKGPLKIFISLLLNAHEYKWYHIQAHRLWTVIAMFFYWQNLIFFISWMNRTYWVANKYRNLRIIFYAKQKVVINRFNVALFISYQNKMIKWFILIQLQNKYWFIRV